MSASGDRPIPVRSVAPPPATTPPPGTSAAEAAGTEPVPSNPPRFLERDGERWEVRAVGRSRTGYGRDAGALLLMVTFTPAEEGVENARGEKGDATSPAVREALTVAHSLEDLDDEVLAELLERSRPMPRRGPGDAAS